MTTEAGPSGSWRFLTWNVDWWRKHAETEPRADVVRRADADVVALQEVSGAVARRLKAAHCGTAIFSQVEYGPATWRWMGCALLFAAGIEVLESGVIFTLPKPQRSLWATVRFPEGLIVTAVSWHAPNAAGDGAATKMAAYRAMTRWLAGRSGPVVLGADLNSWWDSHQLLRSRPDDDFAEEYAFVGPAPSHGLLDAYRSVLAWESRIDAAERDAGDGPLAVSHLLSNGKGHRMDRIYASPRLRPVAARYDLDAGRRGGSDHALHWADFA